MAVLEIGRVCLKIAGRESGSFCVIVDKIDDKFVLITGPKSITKVKRRKCNTSHLEPTSEKFNIDSKADDSRLEKLWKESGLIEKFGIKIPIKKYSEEKVKKSKKA